MTSKKEAWRFGVGEDVDSWPPAAVSSLSDWPDWTPRKLDKQRSERSVTFASIDPLEPIEEDLPQVKFILNICRPNHIHSSLFLHIRRAESEGEEYEVFTVPLSEDCDKPGCDVTFHHKNKTE